MKATSTREPDGFKPITITLTIENEKEFNCLRGLISSIGSKDFFDLAVSGGAKVESIDYAVGIISSFLNGLEAELYKY